MTSLKVNADNFVRAETHRMMSALQSVAGVVNRPVGHGGRRGPLRHGRVPRRGPPRPGGPPTRLTLTADADRPFVMPDYDTAGLDRTRRALLALAAEQTSFDRSFGRREDVDPVRHLIGTAAGWGGLPDTEAVYVGVSPRLPVGEYTLTVGDVPVDGFWSISVYDADGYFEPDDDGAYSVNSITAARDEDGRVTVRFGGTGENTLPITDGWNYLVRLYRPRAEVRDGTWTFPSLTGSSQPATR